MSNGSNRGRKKIPEEDLVGEMQRVGEEVGQSPRQIDMRTHGEYSVQTYKHRFGSWNEAVEASGFEPNDVGGSVGSASKEELISEIQRLAVEFERKPRSLDVRNHSEYSINRFVETFGSWSEAVVAAGYDPHSQGAWSESLISETKSAED